MRRGDADPPQLLMLSTAFTAQMHLRECETQTPELLLRCPLPPPIALATSPVQAVKLRDLPVPEPRAWMLEDKRAPGTACCPSRAWESRDPWGRRESPLQPTSLSDEPSTISSPGGGHQEQTNWRGS